ncbi:hypothetical protein [Bacteroides rodentium]
MSSPACMAQDGEFDVKRAKLTPDINFEMDSTKTAAYLKEVKRQVAPELFKAYTASASSYTLDSYKEFSRQLNAHPSRFSGFLELQRIQLWSIIFGDSVSRDSIGYYCDRIKRVSMQQEVSADVFMRTWFLLILKYVNGLYDSEALLEAQLLMQAAKDIGYDEGMVFANETIARVFYKQKLWRLSMTHYEKTLDFIRQLYFKETGFKEIEAKDAGYNSYAFISECYLLACIRSGDYRSAKRCIGQIERLRQADFNEESYFIYAKCLYCIYTGNEREFLRLAGVYRQEIQKRGWFEDCSDATALINVYHYYEVMTEYYLTGNHLAEAQAYLPR